MRTSFLLLFLSSVLWLNAQWDKNKLPDAFTSHAALKNAPVSICVIDAKTDEILVMNQPHQCVAPASVLKLVTTATALELMGAEKTFVTQMWINGFVQSKTAQGDLVITGSGDPTLGSSYFGTNGNEFIDKWISEVKKKAIDTITGNILIDPSLFSDQEIPQTWIWEDMANYYGAAAQGISLYDNTFELFFDTGRNAGDSCKIIKIVPPIPGLTIDNKVIASNDQRNNAYLFGSPYDNHRVIRGTLPNAKTNFVVRASIPDPSMLLASLIMEKLRDAGVVVLGNFGIRKIDVADSIRKQNMVLEWHSPSLWQIVDQTNHFSINLYAETLCKHIGLFAKNDGSTKAGCEAIKRFWADKGIDVDDFFLADGSGLSRFNALTAQTLTEILCYMRRKSQNSDYFTSSVPLTGMEGTQQYYFSNSFLKGKARAKTGSMTRVRSMAGYITTKSGKDVAFTIMVNNFNGTSTEVSREIEKLMEEIYLKL